MTTPEALTPKQRRMVRADFLRSAVEEARYQRGRLVKVTTEDFALLLDGLAIFDAGLADAERAARQTPDTSELIYEPTFTATDDGYADRLRRESRDAVLDALEAAVGALPTAMAGFDWPKGEPGKAFVVYTLDRAAVLEAIQQQRRQP